MRTMAIVAMLLNGALAFGAEPTADDAAIKAAIEKLDSDDFTEREAGSESLIKMGESIAPKLQSAHEQSHGAESKQRLAGILARWPVGGVVWDFEAGYVFGLPVVDGHRVYVGNKDMTFFCLELETGHVVWKVPIEGMMNASPAVSDERVYVIRTRKNGSPDGTLLCLDAKTGSQLWTFHSEDSQTFTAPMVSGGKLYLVNDSVLFCLDAATGKKIWDYTAPKTILSAPSIADGCVLFGGLDHALHCLAADTGKQLWEFESEDSIYSGAAVAKGRAYVGGNDKKLYCLDLKNGAKLWQVDGDCRFNAAPAVAAGRVYCGGDDGILTCFNAENGERLWAYKAPGILSASPSVCGGRVYAVSISNRMDLLCLNAEDGRQLWTFTSTDAGYATPVLASRRVLLGYCNKFFCVRTGVPGPESWPMTGGNPARTSNGN